MLANGRQRHRCTRCDGLPRTHELPDSEIITVGVKRFRHAEVLFFVVSNGTNRVSVSTALKYCFQPSVIGSEAKGFWDTSFQNVTQEIVEELTASVPSAMKIKVFAPTVNIILTFGAKRAPGR